MKLLLISLASVSLMGYGGDALYWKPAETAAPFSKQDSSHSRQHEHGTSGRADTQKHGTHSMHGGKREGFALANVMSDQASVRLIHPDLSSEILSAERGNFKLPKAKTGGYYALVAEANVSGMEYSAIRYLSTMGKPSRVSPSKLTASYKSALEIVPDPLHREHDRYTASKTYRFVAHFGDTPLTNTPIVLETRNGTFETFITDSHGTVDITLPNDFRGIQPNRQDNKPSEFLLTLQHNADDRHYVTTLSMPYSVNPNDFWQSQQWGAGAVLIGFLGGLIMYRRHSSGVNHG